MDTLEASTTAAAPTVVDTPQQRLQEISRACGWMDEDFLNWLRAQDPQQTPEVYWMPRMVRHFVHTRRLGELYQQPSAEGLSADFWTWLGEELQMGGARTEWLPPAVANAYYGEKLSQFLQSRDLRLPPHRLFQGVDDNFWFWMHTEGVRQSKQLAELLPTMTDPTTAAGYVGSGGDEALREGFQAYKLFKDAFERYVGPIGGCAGILDSGVGWGRIIRFWMKDLEPARIWGVDPEPGALELCRSTNRWCRFEAIDHLPPTQIPDGTFDLIYLFSVFSHLSEPAHQRWLTEFHRILRPGGLLIATTWYRNFITWVADLRRDPNLPCEPPLWRECLRDVFVDTEKTLANYDAGQFCFGEFDPAQYPTFMYEGINSYGDAVIPKGYVEKHWADRFELMEFVDDRSRCTQNVIIAKRK